MVNNIHLACSETFDVQLKDGRSSDLLTMRYDAASHPKKGAYHLQGLARTSATVDALLLGQI